jgi:hypothetical protein
MLEFEAFLLSHCARRGPQRRSSGSVTLEATQRFTPARARCHVKGQGIAMSGEKENAHVTLS